MNAVISGADRERVAFLTGIARQVLRELRIRFTEYFLREAVGSAYYTHCIYGQGAGLNPEEDSIVDQNDPVNLTIVLLDALKQFHIKNEIVGEPNPGENTSMLVTLTSDGQDKSYRNLIGFVNRSTGLVKLDKAEYPLNEIKDRIEHYVVLVPTEFSGEPEYALHRKKDSLRKALFSAAFMLFFIIIAAALYYGITRRTDFFGYPFSSSLYLELYFLIICSRWKIQVQSLVTWQGNFAPPGKTVTIARKYSLQMHPNWLEL